MSNAVMNKKELSKKDLVKAWALVYSSETCYNYERLQACLLYTSPSPRD